MNDDIQDFSKANKEHITREPDKKNTYFGLSEDAVEILRVMKESLRDFPEARAAVMAALDRTEKPR